MANRTKVLITILIAVIVVLLGIVVYAFVIKPTINGYIIQGQNQGLEFAVASIIQRTAPPTCQAVPLLYNNQTINVIAVECLQQPQQQSGQ